MKLFHILFISLPLVTFAQKANDDVTRRSYHHLVYPLNEELSASEFGMTVNENLSCFGTIPGRIYTTPLAEVDPRATFYLNLVPTQRFFFYQSRDLVSNLLKANKKFIHIELETSDLYLSKQTTKSQMMGTTLLYYLSFEGGMQINLTVTSEGEKPVVMIDTSATNSSADKREYRFPLDGSFTTQTLDTKINGYPSEAELLAAWRKYSTSFMKQWRDKYITDFVYPTLFHFKKEQIIHEEWSNCKIYSDKNRKGGYDHIVEAATLFNAAIDAMDDDYKKDDFRKCWKAEHQENFVKAGKIWNKFLAESNFDVTVDDNLISDDYRQEMLLNYIQAQIFTGNFTKANELIESYSKQKLKTSTLYKLTELLSLSSELEKEFNAHATNHGWVKTTETF